MRSPFCLTLILCALARVASAQVTPPLAMEKVTSPVVSPHTFATPPTAWLKVVDHFHVEGDTKNGTRYIRCFPGSPVYVAGEYTSVTYYRTEDDQAKKVSCAHSDYFPSGKVFTSDETDADGSSHYAQFYPDGTLSIYSHTIWSSIGGGSTLCLDGLTVSPSRKWLSRLSGGTGAWIVWGATDDAVTRTYFAQGRSYLIQQYSGAVCKKQELLVPLPGQVNNDSLTWTPKEETLRFSVLLETWTKPTGRRFTAQYDDFYIDGSNGKFVRNPAAKDPISVRVRDEYPHGFSGSVFDDEDDKRRHRERLAQLTKDYINRRAGFIAAYDRVLKGAGTDWSKLGLDTLRVGDTVNVAAASGLSW